MKTSNNTSEKTNYALKWFTGITSVVPGILLGINGYVDPEQFKKFDRLGVECDPLFPFLIVLVWFLFCIAITVFAGNPKKEIEKEKFHRTLTAVTHKENKRKTLPPKEFKKRYPNG